MKMLTLLALSLLLAGVPAGIALADDGAVSGGVGGSIQLMKEHPSVRMDSETVRAVIRPSSVEVTATFKLTNTGGPTDVRIGFPESGYGDGRNSGFKTFASTVDGRAVPVETSRWRKGGFEAGEYYAYDRWRLKTVHFDADQTRLVEVHYQAEPWGDIEGYRWFTYVLRTGASWKGTIGSADIEVDISALRDFQAIMPSPAGFTRDGDTIRWHLASFEPTGKSDIHVQYRWAESRVYFVVNNGEPPHSSSAPLPERAATRMEDGTLMVPATTVAVLLGGELRWDPKRGVVSFARGGKMVAVAVPGATATTGGIPLPRPTRVVGGRAIVPLEPIAAAFGITVFRDPTYGSVYIDHPEAIRKSHQALPIPDAARAALVDRFPDWFAATKGFGGEAGPGWCTGDFDGNGLADHAVLLIRHDRGRLAVLRGEPDDHWTLDELPGPREAWRPGRYGLAPVKPGKVTYWVEPGKDDVGNFLSSGKTNILELRNDGIRLGALYRPSVVYYWTGERFATVITGD